MNHVRGKKTPECGHSSWIVPLLLLAGCVAVLCPTARSEAQKQIPSIQLTLPGVMLPRGNVAELPLELGVSATAPDTLVLKLAFNTNVLSIADVVAGEASAGKLLTWRQTESGLAVLIYGGSGALASGTIATLVVEAAGSAEPGTFTLADNGSSASTSSAERIEVALTSGDIVVSALDDPHTADMNADGQINLAELLRAIQLYNASAYACSDGSEDGFTPAGEEHDCTPHDLDYVAQDWRIELTELLRCVQFYNAPGSAYHRDEAGEDGFAPGPEQAR